MTIRDFGYMLLLVFLLWPWAFLLIDGIALFLVGYPISFVPWDAIRIWVAIIWPFAWLMLAAAF